MVDRGPTGTSCPCWGHSPGCGWPQLGLLGVLGLELEPWLGAQCHRVGSSPPARAWGVSPAGGWDRGRAGGTGGDCTAVFSLHLPGTVPDLLLERGTEVEMPSLGGGCCALLMVPVPSLCRSGAAVPSSSCSDGKHPQILQMASGQELSLGQAVHSRAV